MGGFLALPSGGGWGYRRPVRIGDVDLIVKQPTAICDAEHASPRKPLNSSKMTKQQLIENVAAKTELRKPRLRSRWTLFWT